LPRWLLKYFCIAWIGSTSVLFFPYAIGLELWKRIRGGRGHGSMEFIQTLWSRMMLWAPGAELEIIGREHCDPKRPVIIASNHQSTLDIPALMIAFWPTEIRFVAKKIIKYVPLFGWYMALAGFVFVDRGNKREGRKSLQIAADKIAAGTSIIIFPEGTRSADGEIGPFKKGTFALATMAKVPICPVAIEGSRHVMPQARWDVRPGKIRVKIGAPIDVTPFGNDREALTKAVRDRIIDLAVDIGGPGGNKEDAIARDGAPRPADGEAPPEGAEA
jgi:1-acyl-sn-glycerol-3-phosphate acyltransferase